MASKHLNDNKEDDNVSENNKSEDLKEDDNDSEDNTSVDSVEFTSHICRKMWSTYATYAAISLVNDQFLQACKDNDLDGDFGVKFWIAKGADVNYWTYEDMNSERFHGEGYGTVSGLFRKKDTLTVSGLVYATIKNYPELCDWLLAHPDIDVNMKCIRRGSFSTEVDTPLTLAVKAGHSSIVKKLVKAPGIDLNFQSLDGLWNDGESAALLSMLSACNIHSPSINLDCVKVFTETEGVDWHLEDSKGFTPFIRALMNKRMDSVKCLKVLRNVSSIDWNNIYPPDYGFKCSPFCYSLGTDYNKIQRNVIPRFLLTLPDVQVDIDELKERYCFDKAVMACKQHVLNKIKKKYKTFWKGLTKSLRESVCSAAIFNIEAAQSARKLAESNALWLKYSNPQSQHTHTITVTTLKARLLWNAQKFNSNF